MRWPLHHWEGVPVFVVANDGWVPVLVWTGMENTKFLALSNLGPNQHVATCCTKLLS
jgi:hypothetical protein